MKMSRKVEFSVFFTRCDRSRQLSTTLCDTLNKKIGNLFQNLDDVYKKKRRLLDLIKRKQEDNDELPPTRFTESSPQLTADETKSSPPLAADETKSLSPLPADENMIIEQEVKLKSDDVKGNDVQPLPNDLDNDVKPDIITEDNDKTSDEETSHYSFNDTNSSDDDEPLYKCSKDDLYNKISILRAENRKLKKKQKELEAIVEGGKYSSKILKKLKKSVELLEGVAVIPSSQATKQVMRNMTEEVPIMPPWQQYEDVEDEELFKRLSRKTVKKFIGEALEKFYRREQLVNCSIRGGVANIFKNMPGARAVAKKRIDPQILERIKNFVVKEFPEQERNEKFDREFNRAISEKCNNAGK